MRPLLRPRVVRLRVAALAVVALLAACTITPPSSLRSVLTIPSVIRSGTLDQYRVEVAHRVAERNPS
ncbi:hypothetical protein KPA97_16940, partial [Burkholderia cenocepacia]|nr:hypothetical protein [Burkholderia cenocepacia]